MTPGTMLGPRCNHDLGVLAKFPVFTEASAASEDAGVCTETCGESGAFPDVSGGDGLSDRGAVLEHAPLRGQQSVPGTSGNKAWDVIERMDGRPEPEASPFALSASGSDGVSDRGAAPSLSSGSPRGHKSLLGAGGGEPGPANVTADALMTDQDSSNTHEFLLTFLDQLKGDIAFALHVRTTLATFPCFE